MGSENSKALEGNGCSSGEERRNSEELAVLEAAETLVAMKRKKISEKEAKALQELMAKHRSDDNNEEEECCYEVPDDFPELDFLRGLVEECSGVAVEKQLTHSDVVDGQNRLSLTKRVVEESFLPMLKDDEDVKSGIPVSVYDVDGNVYSLKFIFWSRKLYVLNGGWKQFYMAHGLRENQDWVKVWMFRHSRTHKLCFLITHTRLPP